MLSKYTAEILATAIHNGVDAQQIHNGNTCSGHTQQSGLLRKDTAEMLAHAVYKAPTILYVWLDTKTIR